MKKKQLLAMILAGAMAVGFAGCSNSNNDSGETSANSETVAGGDDANTETNSEDANSGSASATPLVIATEEMSEKFSPFFCQSVPDQRVTDMTQVALLGNDRSGEIIYNGIEGETKSYNGTDYFYSGISDCTITENDDGTVSYEFKLREDIQFSDGVPLTADDVIFTYYTIADPSYDGGLSLYSLPIKGLEEYRSGATPLYKLMLEKGADNTDFTYYTEEDQKKFFEEDLPAAGDAWVQNIIDFCVANGYSESDKVADVMSIYGYADAAQNYTDPTNADFFNEIVAAYDGDYQTASDTETAEATLFDMLDDSYKNTVETGDSVDYIEGITKTSDYSVRIDLTTTDATAIYQLAVPVAPMHYYGDTSKYDYDNHKFGFDKGDLSVARSKTSAPLGAGPYKYVKYENKVCYLEANENYCDGTPKTKNLQFKETTKPDMIPGVVQGAIDIGEPNVSKSVLEQISGENSNGEINGDKLTTTLVDYRGYGYIGMNSKNVCVGGDGSTEQSKDLRKAIATVLAVYRDVAVDSYYGESATVINYPISSTSWAAPKKSDPDYKVAFSTDVNGDPIYTEGMTEDEKYAAALNAALGFFEAAGYTVTDGMITAAPEGAKLSYELIIPGEGTGNHPSFGIVTNASNALKTIGFDLKINDVSDGNILWNALDAGTTELWCAAWQTTLDPDMFQIYHSEGGDANRYCIYSKELDEMVMDAKTHTDQAYRKAKYKECLDFVVDYAVEIPIYQRQIGFVYSSERINTDTIAKDQTTYYDWMAEIDKIEMK